MTTGAGMNTGAAMTGGAMIGAETTGVLTNDEAYLGMYCAEAVAARAKITGDFMAQQQHW